MEGNLTIDDLKTDSYQAQSRNKLVTEAFYLTKDIEKYGSGYRRIREYISEYPTMSLDFEENSGGFLTKIGYEEQKVFEKSNNVPDNVTDKVPEKVTDNQRQIMKLISENPYITTNLLAKNMGISQRKIKENIAKLKTKKLIERIGSNKGRYWKIIENK